MVPDHFGAVRRPRGAYSPAGLMSVLSGLLPGRGPRRNWAGVVEGGPRGAASPAVHWPDQEQERLEGSLHERLGHWLTLVQRGQVLEAYRVFLGLMEEPQHRREVLAELVFAGLIDACSTTARTPPATRPIGRARPSSSQ